MGNIGGLTECRCGTPVLDPRTAMFTHTNMHSSPGMEGVPALAASLLSPLKFGPANDSCSVNVGDLNWRCVNGGWCCLQVAVEHSGAALQGCVGGGGGGGAR